MLVLIVDSILKLLLLLLLILLWVFSTELSLGFDIVQDLVLSWLKSIAHLFWSSNTSVYNSTLWTLSHPSYSGSWLDIPGKSRRSLLTMALEDRRRVSYRWNNPAICHLLAGARPFHITAIGVLLARTIATASHGVFSQLLSTAFDQSLLFLKKAIFIIPEISHTTKSVCPLLMATFLDKASLGCWLRSLFSLYFFLLLEGIFHNLLLLEKC